MLTANIVGLGRIGFEFSLDALRPQPSSHLGALKELSEYIKVIGLCDLSRNKQSAAHMFYENNVECFSSYNKMLRENPADILVIATNPITHFEIISDAIHSVTPPKLIFCEKPLADNLTIAEKMVELCKQKNVVLAVNHTRRWEESWILAKKLSEEIGDFTFHGRFSGRIDHVGIHICDLAVWFGAKDTYVTHHPLFPYLIFEVDLVGEKGRIIIKENGRVVDFYKSNPSFYYEGINELIREYKTTFSYDKVSNIPDTPIFRAYKNIIHHLNSGERLKCVGENGLEAMYALNKFVGITN